MARPRTDIKPRIVRAARARFIAEGVDGASLRTIASDAKTNVGMIFYYFPTKDDLFLAAIEDVYVALLFDLERALAGDAPVRERLERLFVRLGRASEDELDVVRLVLREVLLSSTRFGRVFARFRKGHIAMLLSVLAEGVQRGELDASIPLPMLLLSTAAMGAVPQFVRRATERRSPFDALPSSPERLAALSAELLFRAIGASVTKRTRAPKSAPTKHATASAKRPRTPRAR